jgi:hypothetical protein
VSIWRGPRACKLNGRDGSLYCPSCDEESYSQLADGTYLYGMRQCKNGHRSREVRVPAGIELVRRTLNPDVEEDGVRWSELGRYS